MTLRQKIQWFGLAVMVVSCLYSSVTIMHNDVILTQFGIVGSVIGFLILFLAGGL